MATLTFYSTDKTGVLSDLTTTDKDSFVDAINEVDSHADACAIENLIPFPYAETSVTKNGLTFTINEDGSVTVSGVASATTTFILSGWTTEADVPVMDIDPDATYTLTGSPSGSSTSTYCLSARVTASGTTPSSYSGSIKRDLGDGVSFTGFAYCCPYIAVWSGVDISNGITFYPMLVKGNGASEYRSAELSAYNLLKRIEALESN